jgi:Leucine-rich repeat (LRR) protein
VTLGAVLVGILGVTGCGGEREAGEETGPPTDSELHSDVDPSTSRQPAPEPLPSESVAWTPERAHEALQQRNPDYNGRALFQFENETIIAAQLSETGVTDLAPLEGMRLQGLDLGQTDVRDLTPLRGLPLRELFLESSRVSDLAPLEGMPLTELYLNQTPVEDLTPLRGLPLVKLNLLGTKVRDLTPLREMPLEFLWLDETAVDDILPLSHCPLSSLTLHRTNVADLTPLIGTDLKRLHIDGTPVTDLTPVATLKLTRLIFTPARIERGIDAVRTMTTIREIGTTSEERMNPARFWALYDQGAFN